MDNICDIAKRGIVLIDAFEAVNCLVVLTAQEEILSLFVNLSETRIVVGVLRLLWRLQAKQ